MRSKIFMYLFFFAVLWIVFQYANEKNIFESQDRKIVKLDKQLSRAEDSLVSLQNALQESSYFSLSNNENAYSYFDRFGVDVENLEEKIQTQIISKNTVSGNSLIPYDNATGVFKINKVSIINHKWLIADFSDGQRWGELLIRYDIADDGSITFENLRSLIYPTN